MNGERGAEALDESRNKVLLLEIVVVLLFFSVSAVTTLQLFARASALARRNALDAQALVRCEDVAERLRVHTDPAALLTAEAGWTDVQSTADEFSAGWTPEGADYTLRVTGERVEQPGGSLWEMRVQALDAQGGLRVDLPVARYVPEGGPLP